MNQWWRNQWQEQLFDKLWTLGQTKCSTARSVFISRQKSWKKKKKNARMVNEKQNLQYYSY